MNNLVYEKKLTKGIFRVYNSKPETNFQFVKQIHSCSVIKEENIQGVIEADGIASHSSNPLCTFTADCLPIVIEGQNGHALIHAGWKGVRDEIIAHQNVKDLKPNFAFIGPHICHQCYEVQADFKVNFPNAKTFEERNGKIYFNLEAEIKNQLLQFYPDIKIESANLCTLETSNLHSFRRNKTTERNYNLYFPVGDKT